ncbi:MAG TPA: YfhO family protein, partial [Vicinamibacteria bacterium]|nr:YfhO family protein [Vicinamibacteria bacterium]
RHELWSFAVVFDTLSPDTNLHEGVATALTPDRTMLVPTDRVLSPEAASPQALPYLIPRLREGAVSHVLSLDPLAAPGLALEESLAPPRLAPLTLRVYRIDQAKALAEVAAPDGEAGRVISFERQGDRLTVDVELRKSGRLRLREGLSRGWRARVDGGAAAIEPAGPAAVAVSLQPGRHRVAFDYRPPLLWAGALLTALSAGVAVAIVLRPRRAAPAGAGQ